MFVYTAWKGTKWSKEPYEEPDYSDWKVTLAKKGDPFTSSQMIDDEIILAPPSTITYSVHRNMVGPQSEYFNRIFKSNAVASSSSVCGFSEFRHQHVHIDFSSNTSIKTFGLIVKAFEALLDYCYLEDMDLEGTSPAIVLHLCDYFQMKDDFESKVDDYSKIHFNEMASKSQLHLLYHQIIELRAIGLNVERAQTIISEICCNRMSLLSKGTQLAVIADLPLWLNITLCIEVAGFESKQKYATNIANFLDNNDNVDFDSFQKLTDEMILPCVPANAALVFLKKEQVYASIEANISDDNNDHNEGESPALTNLQSRCLKSLVEAKLELNINKEFRDQATKVMTLLPRSFMGLYLTKTLNSYGEEKMKLEQQLEEQKNIAWSKEQALAREGYEHEQESIRLKKIVSKLENEQKVVRLQNSSLMPINTQTKLLGKILGKQGIEGKAVRIRKRIV